MKKVLAMLLASSMLLAFVACNKPAETTTGGNVETTTTAGETTTAKPVESTTTEAPNTPVTPADKTAHEFFKDVFKAYLADATIDENTKMPGISGGDAAWSAEVLAKMEAFATENPEATEEEWIAFNESISGPGTISLTEDNRTTLEGIGFPVDKMNLVDSAASGYHGMMQNFFYVTMYHVADPANVTVLADAYKESITKTNFVCGQPEGYTILTTGNYVIAVFGLFEMTDPFVQGVKNYCTDEVVVATGSFF